MTEATTAVKSKSRAKHTQTVRPASQNGRVATPEPPVVVPDGPLGTFYTAGPAPGLGAPIQAKLTIGQANDSYEREADGVADAVMAGRRAPTISRLPTGGPNRFSRLQVLDEEPVPERAVQRQADEEAIQESTIQPQNEEPVQKWPLQRQAEESIQASAIQRQETGAGQPNEELPMPMLIQRQEGEDAIEETPPMPMSIRRQAEERPEAYPQAAPGEQSSAAMAPPQLSGETEQRIARLRGRGAPLPDTVRNDMGEKMGADFSEVGVHTGGDAAELNRQVGARAFTVGNDIFFASGEYAPASPGGQSLLAHELTHVVQSTGNTPRLFRQVEPTPSPVPASGSPAADRLADLSILELPPIKHRHAALYAGAGARRAAGYARRTSQSQVTVWNNGIQLSLATIEQKLREQYRELNKDFTAPTSQNAQISLRAGSREISTRWGSLRNRLLIPDWDRRGQILTTRQDKFQVDHMVELQVFGDTTGNAGNVIGNLELLKGSPNASSGSAIRNRIYDKVTAFLVASDPAFSGLSGRAKATRRRNWLRTHSITFPDIRRGEGRAGNDSDWWTRTEIETGAPLDAVEPAPETRLEGSPGNFVLASGQGGVEIARYGYQNLQFEPATERLRKAMAGVYIREIQLNAAAEQGNAGAAIGHIAGTWDLPRGFREGETVQIPLVAVGPYSGAPNEIPSINTDFSHLSPVSLPQPEVRDGRLYAEGQIRPNIPLLRDHPISVVLEGDDLRFEIEYATNMLNLPLPGISLDEGSIALFFSTREGFGGSGRVEFSVERLGNGYLEVQVGQRTGFSATGSFDFDTELFDRANIRVWYRDRAFGGEGEIGIDNPDKIRGIRSANLTVGFGENQFNARGDVQPDIPGVQQAGLSLSYSETDGLAIGGNLQLSSDVPGIESGSIEVTVREREEEWKVSADGTAVPSIPGLNSNLSVSYNDGAFTSEVTADYARGMLSGRLNAGVTNRNVGEDGQLSESAAPDNPLIVYGGGQLTIQIAPWLQGIAGVQFAPDGEITVTGEIGLPGELEIFPRREFNKSIFNIAVQAPIFPGIVAEIGGGLGATAGIGAGVIDQLRLGITYNPAREEDTTITGDAHLRVPADAGLRLSVRAGIGLGITGASATGGLEIGGTLGIEGAAEAGVHIDWTPSRGLDLTATVSVHAQPAFVFDISGYVSVRALGFSVYDQTWELASFRFGSDYRFGINLPIHYQEGQPFDISLDDIEFEVPDIDTDELLESLIATVA